MTTLDPRRTFSTPMDAPLVPTPPFRYRNTVIFTAFYRTDPEASKRILPEPLEPVGDLVIVHVYQVNDTDWFGAYNESAVQIPVVFPLTGERGVYAPYLFLDHDGAIAFGREVYGQPKKFGLPSIEIRQDLVVAKVARNGIDLLTLTMPYKTQASSVEEMRQTCDFVTNINLKVIPNIDGRGGIRQLTARRLLDVVVHECWTAPATVEIRPNAQAPVYRLPVREMLAGFLWRCDFTLDYGRVLYDYLTAEA